MAHAGARSARNMMLFLTREDFDVGHDDDLAEVGLLGLEIGEDEGLHQGIRIGKRRTKDKDGDSSYDRLNKKSGKCTGQRKNAGLLHSNNEKKA